METYKKAGSFRNIESPNDVVDGIMNGSIQPRALDWMEISDISIDVRLRNAYKKSKARSIQQFLNLKDARFKIRNYGKRSETILRMAISEFISEKPENVFNENVSLKSFNLNAFIQKLISSDSPWNELSEEQWSDYRNKLRASESRLTHIYNMAARIGVYWPLSTYKKLNTDTLEKYLNCTLCDLRQIRGFGKAKISSYIACVVHFSEGNPNPETIDPPLIANNHKTIISRLLKSKSPWSELNEKQWSTFRNKLIASELRLIPIYFAAAQIGTHWPYAPKKRTNTDTLEKYLNCTLRDLTQIRGFGRQKIRSYIACVVHFSEVDPKSEAIVKNKSLRERIVFVWDNINLTQREKLVIESRFGIRMRKYTLEELAWMLSVTRERIRQIEKKAIFKLKLAQDVKETALLLANAKFEIWDHLSAGKIIKKTAELDFLEDRLPFEFHLAIELCADRKNRGIHKAAIGDWLSDSFPNDESNWYREQIADCDIKLQLDKNINSSLSELLNIL
jgi:hypothetical protein